MPKLTKPTPDGWGRLRVLDEDTGHRLTIQADRVHLGRFVPLTEPASDLSGDPLPPEHADPGDSESVESTNPTGRTADTSKE